MHLLEAQIHMYFHFLWGIAHKLIQQAWEHFSEIPREQLVAPETIDTQVDTPIMFITTISSASYFQNFA